MFICPPEWYKFRAVSGVFLYFILFFTLYAFKISGTASQELPPVSINRAWWRQYSDFVTVLLAAVFCLVTFVF